MEKKTNKDSNVYKDSSQFQNHDTDADPETMHPHKPANKASR